MCQNCGVFRCNLMQTMSQAQARHLLSCFALMMAISAVRIGALRVTQPSSTCKPMISLETAKAVGMSLCCLPRPASKGDHRPFNTALDVFMCMTSALVNVCRHSRARAFIPYLVNLCISRLYSRLADVHTVLQFVT